MPEFLSEDTFFRLFVVHVAVAIFCGGLIGMERQLRGKPAGLRVCILVVLTTSFFVTISTEVSTAADQARVMSAIITGVGFLGAGVIFSQNGHIQGITTASLIWALSAVGCTIGFGYPGVALLATIIIMGTLMLVDEIERLFPRLRRELEPDEER